MPSLIGNKPNQVPTNGDLGTLAFEDHDNVLITGGAISGNIATTGLNFDSNTFVIDATNNRVGVGTASPIYPLQVNGKAYALQSVNANGSASAPSYAFGNDEDCGMYRITDDTVGFATAGTERMRLTASGNLGLGVTPSAWQTAGGQKVFQFDTGSIYGNSSNNIYLSSNFFLNSSGQNTYIESDFATSYGQVDGTHQWYTAPSGTAGNAVTFTQAMTLDASGNLMLGRTSSNSTFTAQGVIANTGATSASSPSGTGLLINASATSAALNAHGSSLVFAQSWTSGTPSSTIATGQITGVKTANDGSFGGGLAFWSSNGSGNNLLERMRITDTGNVGIGTSSAGEKLDVNGKIRVGGTVSGQSIAAFNGDATNAQRMQITTSGTDGVLQATRASGTVPNMLFLIDSTERMRIDSSGNLLFNSGYGSVATAYGCRAWVNFNGTGTVAINGSGNVTSITDNGTGDYTVNFTTAMPDTNYSVVAGCVYVAGSGVLRTLQRLSDKPATTSGVSVIAYQEAGGAVDAAICDVAIFR